MRNFLQGFRTIIFNTVAAIAPWFGVDYDAEIASNHKTALTITIVAIANILLRIITKTPAGKKDKERSKSKRQNKIKQD